MHPPKSGKKLPSACLLHRNAILAALALWSVPLPAQASDSAAGDPTLAQAMESLSRGTLPAAKEAVDSLAGAAKTSPANPIYEKLRGEIEILFRAEHGIAQSLHFTEEAKKTAEMKIRSMKLSLEPSKLTGKNDPVSAERYRLQAEELLADAQAGEARAKRNFLLALQRADTLAADMLDKGEETVAHGLGNALWAMSERNISAITREDGSPFTPSLSRTVLEDLKIKVAVRQTWVRQGLEKEKSGDRAAALELFQKAGYTEGIRRLGEK